MGLKPKRAKRAIAQAFAIYLLVNGCRPLRGLFVFSPMILGFRFAPPQALCCRRASRAELKVCTLNS